FRISPGGSLASLWEFSTTTNGANPNSSLVQGSDGSFYGTAYQGGAHGYGTVFKISVPLSHPANQISAVQLGASNVILAIPSVAGETYQLQFSASLALGSWTNVAGASMTNSPGGLLTFTNF